jgi:tRNA(Ile2) C34 agmatinyltransferase TiaS
MRGTVESIPPLVMIVGAALVAGLALLGWQRYQRCPHCGRVVRRAQQGWLRCGVCGRQYRKGLRLR